VADVKCGNAKCSCVSEEAEIMDDIFANVDSGDKLMLYVDGSYSDSEDESVV
jgi:hypothetical protein